MRKVHIREEIEEEAKSLGYSTDLRPEMTREE